MQYAYYPGCASQEVTKEANWATRAVAGALDIDLHDMPSANCCGAGLLTDYDYELYIALNARILAQAEIMGMDIMTICSTCLMVMSTANRDLKADPVLVEKTNATLSKVGLKYSGEVKVKQLSWVLIEDYGLENLKRKVVRPLKGLKTAPFYGCHSLRPSDALGFDDPEMPTSLERLIDVLGGDIVEYGDRTKCCGFQVDLVTEDVALDMMAKRLLGAKDEGGACVVTPCPFCHVNLDSYQGMAAKKVNRKISMPIFHLAQLVGVALGMGDDELKLSRNIVSPEGLLERIGIRI